jgi:hypothetical protein
MRNSPGHIPPTLRRKVFTAPRETGFPMSRATPQMWSLAKRIIDDGTSKNKEREAKIATAVHVVDQIRSHLVPLMGAGGFRALLLRALVLAGSEVAWLREVHVNAAGLLEGAEALRTKLDQSAYREGRIALLAQLLGLLVALIGPSLTMRLVGEIWPRVSLNDIDFGTGATT